MLRRSFLKLVGLAPVVATVGVKEAEAKQSINHHRMLLPRPRIIGRQGMTRWVPPMPEGAVAEEFRMSKDNRGEVRVGQTWHRLEWV
jgi:hypothetical protein